MLFLSFWALIELLPIPRWGIVFILCLIPIQSIWHQLLWNTYILPEHNISECTKWKILFCQLPHTLLTAGYFALFGYVRLLALFYAIALCGTTLYMRIPPPWSNYKNPPKDTIISLWKDRDKADYWNGKEWETFALSTN